MSFRRTLMTASIVLVAACATLPVPNDAFDAANLSIAKAEEARAAEFAPQPLQNARDKLRVAHEEIERNTDQSYVAARRLAEQAQADAELAQSMAEVARARIASAEVNRSIEMLVQQQQRK